MSPRTPRLLDLFCGAGGAAEGYRRAGFEVFGVDKYPQPNFPFEFHQSDALTYPLGGFDAIHASPPCQAWSDLEKRNKAQQGSYPQLIKPMRTRLSESGAPYIIENVETAPLLPSAIMLCGTMFPKLRVIRHRKFECSFPVLQLPDIHPRDLRVWTYDKRKSQYKELDARLRADGLSRDCTLCDGTLAACQSAAPRGGCGSPALVQARIADQYDPDRFVSVNGGGNCTLEKARSAMGIDWMTKGEINEAIPPAYTEYVGRWLLQVIRSA